MFKLKKEIRSRISKDRIYTNITNKQIKNDSYYELSDSDIEQLIVLLIERIEIQDKTLTQLKKMLGGKN